MRKICYFSGTRADYGLMRAVLQRLEADTAVDLSICVTGMHLSALYGMTVNEIIAAGFRICAQIPVDVESTLPETMANAIGHEIIGMTAALMQEKPDLVLLLGDRGEMLAAAIAAVHLNIPIVHIHGGERSGTVDEMVRHAVSKLAHFHFVATEGARERLIKMGEHPEKVFLTGAPGLDEIVHHQACSRLSFCQEFNLMASKSIALIIFHPVVQEYHDLNVQMYNLLEAALSMNFQIICLEPNSDAGGQNIRAVLADYQHHPDIRMITHLTRHKYLDCLANVDILLGNSSSGIIEAASFNLTVVNVGSRQTLRERGDNIIDTGTSQQEILAGIQSALERESTGYVNIYGDGNTSPRCCEILKTLPLDTEILNKYNAY